MKKHNAKKNYRAILLGVIFAMCILSMGIQVLGADWPKIIEAKDGIITIYQPQPETLDGTFLSGRAAISVKLSDAKQPIFGAIWITSTIVVDRDSRTATLTGIEIPNIRFSDQADSSVLVRLIKLIDEEIPLSDFEVSLDDLITTLENTSTISSDNFKTEPPEIIIANEPSILIPIDGDPVLKDLEGFDFRRVENSAYFIIFDSKAKMYYLYGDQIWYSARDIMGEWVCLENPSSSLKKLQEDIENSKSEEPNDPASESAPSETRPEDLKIIVRTSPAELIVINGDPEFTPVQGTELLYVSNSDDNIFMDIQSQSYFILVSGRWYAAKGMDGPWAYTDPNNLPGEFEKIPEGSDNDVVLASVPGTNAAIEAILDTQIPQTAEIDRQTATVNVEYDGEPKFEKVEGTSMLYAVNSPQTVLKLGNTYYCVDNGVWFESSDENGPWMVAVDRPDEVEEIEPSSPVYNVKYVYIYDYTPTVVYTGYTPGYYGCYVYGPTVIYGTGYYYKPWYGSYYYPRPVTYGFNMHYNPWTGWSMSVGVSYGGWFHMSYRRGYPYGYWGPPLYRPPYYMHYHHHHHGGYYGHNSRPVPYNSIHRNAHNGNVYANNRQGVKPTTRPSTGNVSGRSKTSNRQPSNNIYTDRNGNVYQKSNQGWQKRQDNTWKPADNTAGSRPSTRPSTQPSTRPSTSPSNRPSTQPSTRPSTQPSTRPSTQPSTRPSTSPSTRPSTSQSYNRNSLDRQSAGRQRGATRSSNYNNYSRSGQSGAPSGAGRSSGRSSGGARRR